MFVHIFPTIIRIRSLYCYIDIIGHAWLKDVRSGTVPSTFVEIRFDRWDGSAVAIIHEVGHMIQTVGGHKSCGHEHNHRSLCGNKGKIWNEPSGQLFFDGSHLDVSSLELVNSKKFKWNITSLLWLEWQTCFDPTWSSSGLHYELINYKTAHILGIPNNVHNNKYKQFSVENLIVKAWWWPSIVETCCHSNQNEL